VVVAGKTDDCRRFFPNLPAGAAAIADNDTELRLLYGVTHFPTVIAVEPQKVVKARFAPLDIDHMESNLSLLVLKQQDPDKRIREKPLTDVGA